MDRAGTAVSLGRQCLPLAPRAQHVHDPFKHKSGILGLTSASGLSCVGLIGDTLPHRDQWLNTTPKLIGNFPCFCFGHLLSTRGHRAWKRIILYLRISSKKSLKEKYGADKLAIARETLRHPQALDDYREVSKRSSRPLTHAQLAEIERIPVPNLRSLLLAVTSINTGHDGAVAYEDAIEKLLSALFFPSLSSPMKQTPIHEGRKRIDITYVNNPVDGFFRWLLSSYSSAHIFVECKNYGNEIGNPELDQLTGRFSPSRGQVGILVCRSVADERRLEERCLDAAHDQRGYVLTLSDADLSQLVDDYSNSNGGSEYPLLMTKFRKLVMN